LWCYELLAYGFEIISGAYKRYFTGPTFKFWAAFVSAMLLGADDWCKVFASYDDLAWVAEVAPVALDVPRESPKDLVSDKFKGLFSLLAAVVCYFYC
jgi:hypothetical protein